MKFVYSDGGRSQYFKATGVGDCVVRSICNATGMDYKEVYDGINELAKVEKVGKHQKHRSSARNGVSKKVYKKYIEEILGWQWHGCTKVGVGCTMHLNENELPSGTLIVSLSKHNSCVKDGVLYDTYDCSREGTRCVYGYWSQKKTSNSVAHPKKKTYNMTEYAVHIRSNDGKQEHYLGHYTTLRDAEECAEKRRSWGNRNVYIVEREVSEWKRLKKN